MCAAVTAPCDVNSGGGVRTPHAARAKQHRTHSHRRTRTYAHTHTHVSRSAAYAACPTHHRVCKSANDFNRNSLTRHARPTAAARGACTAASRARSGGAGDAAAAAVVAAAGVAAIAVLSDRLHTSCSIARKRNDKNYHCVSPMRSSMSGGCADAMAPSCL